MAKKYKKSRVRTLLKEQKTKGEYATTKEDCDKWFDILNEELFNSELPKLVFGFKRLRVCWAYYEYFPRTPEKALTIILCKTYPSKKLFVECLAHEMVHHWQYVSLGWRKVDHGNEFKTWSKKAKCIGLRISEEQSE